MVCGGPTVRDNQLITPELIDEIESYAAFAPLHTPIAVYIMREALRLFPGIPNFACLDTYFHRTMPEVVTHMPIPEEYSAMGVRRYGFTAFPTSRSSTSCSPTCRRSSSWRTWATAPPSPPSATASAWTRPWA